MNTAGPRRFPTGAEYVDALQNTGLCFEDLDLKRATPDLDRLGRPRPISGNFASVFALTSTAGEKFAVKCFTREAQDQERRYRAISDHLATVNHPWKVDFEYILRGVLVMGNWYPVLKMRWVTGIGLVRWIDANLHDQAALGRLAANFAKLVEQLAAAGIGHGDLQHGNLLVAPDGSLRLVDYDGMYVPALAGLPPAEMGHRNYQSPMRGQTEFGPDLDRFSAWVIYLALVAISSDPSLWQQLHEPDGEYLLLSEEDFTDPATSIRFALLLGSAAPEIRKLAALVRDALTQPLSSLKPLNSSNTRIPSASSDFSAPFLAGSAAPHILQPPKGTLPSWMAGHLPPKPLEPPVIFRGPRPLLALGLLIPAMLAPALLVVLGLINTLAVSGDVGVGLAALSAMAFRYRRRSEVAEARNARQRRAETAQHLRGLDRELKQIEKEQTSLDLHMTKTHEDLAARRNSLQELFVKADQRADRELETQLIPIETELRNLTSLRQRKLSMALSKLQEAHVRSRLARITIANSPPHGIGAKLVANLKAAGISTAADFTGIVLISGSYQNADAYFVLAGSTHRVKVPGIGEVKAQTLNEWRQSHETHVRRSQPRSLPAAERQAILAGLAAREKKLKSQKEAARQHSAAKRVAARKDLESQQAQLTAEEQNARASAAQARVVLNQRMAVAKSALTSADQALTAAIADVDRYRRVTFFYFLRFSLTG
ncbi:hypothetical protein AB0C69_26145 [Actinomadura sp. NPDC048032]|uniref:hypothetical protein n=1 Tax=Actinomadura sp. NPDC048032 TaxID=3155747 RepID=UPI0033E220FB